MFVEIFWDISGKSSFVAPLPKFSENGTAPENPSPSNKLVTLHPMSSDDVKITDRVRRQAWTFFSDNFAYTHDRDSV